MNAYALTLHFEMFDTQRTNGKKVKFNKKTLKINLNLRLASRS